VSYWLGESGVSMVDLNVDTDPRRPRRGGDLLESVRRVFKRCLELLIEAGSVAAIPEIMAGPPVHPIDEELE